MDFLSSKSMRNAVQSAEVHPVRPNDFSGVPIWVMFQFELTSSLFWAVFSSFFFDPDFHLWTLVGVVYIAIAYNTLGRETDCELMAMLCRWMARPEDGLSLYDVLVKFFGQLL